MVENRKHRAVTARIALSLVAAAVVGGPAAAHHSFNMFDMENMIQLEGRVTEFDYINPHGWVVIETTDAAGESVVWEVETISALIMGRRGIERDSLAVGDWVRIEAHPARNPERRIANGEVVHTLDGRQLVVGFQSGNPELELGQPAVLTPASSMAGTWRGDSRLADVADPPILTEWPLTSQGRAAFEAYDGSQNPYAECVPYSPPVQMMAPLTMTIELADDVVNLIFGLAGDDRIVYLDGRGHPADAPAANSGHSIGRWEGETLVIDTANFTARDLGLAFGIPSGAGKRLIERLTLSEDGTRIAYRYEVTDPEFLAAPVTGESTFSHRPDLALEDYSCDPESARRFLDVF